MATNDLGEGRLTGKLNRPCWPYESWSDSTTDESVSEHNSDKELEDGLKQSEVDLEQMEEPDHWLNDLDDDVEESCPIWDFLNSIDSPDVSSTPEAVEIRSEIVQIMEKTLQDLTMTYKIFKDSYVMAVGSMTENSKIYKVDEFDFAVLLPALAEKDIFSLLLRKDSIKTDSVINELIADLQQTGDEAVILDFSKHLKHLWSMKMLCHAAPKWEILDTSCYSDDVSVAGTFHLKRNKDHCIIDLDVCFWVPLNDKILSSAPDELEQKQYLLENCQDEQGFVYAILPRDEGIEFSLNVIRFAMSSLERENFQKYGPENNRLKCYRFCKCVVSRLVPKFRKRGDCSYCFENLVSSFCLKNIVFYLGNAYPGEQFWTNEQVPNRVVEVFAILSLCMKVNFYRVSAYFAPYEIQINRTLRFDPERKCIFTISCPEETKQCALPKIEELAFKVDDEISKRVLLEYDKFLKEEEWGFPDVICRLTEVLSTLRTEDTSERNELANNVGWNSYGLT